MNVPVILLSIIVAVLACLAIWSHLRLRRLSRVVETLAAGSDAKELLANRWRFRFSLRSMFILMTVVALVLGLFGSELLRARRQRDALDSIANELTADVYGDYRRALLAEGFVGEIAAQWLEPDLGWHLRGLSITTMNSTTINSLQLEPPITSYNAEKLGDLISLEALQIMGVDLTAGGTNFLENLTKLRRLSFVNCRLPDESLASIINCSELEHLQLYKCRVSINDLHYLSKLSKLTSLDLAHSQINDQEVKIIAQLSGLRALNLDATQVTDEGIKHLLHLQHLGWLSVGNTAVGDTGVSYLLDVPSIHELRLYDTLATPNCRDWLEKMPKLQRVWLRQKDLPTKVNEQLCEELPGIDVLVDYPDQELQWEFSGYARQSLPSVFVTPSMPPTTPPQMSPSASP